MERIVQNTKTIRANYEPTPDLEIYVKILTFNFQSPAVLRILLLVRSWRQSPGWGDHCLVVIIRITLYLFLIYGRRRDVQFWRSSLREGWIPWIAIELSLLWRRVVVNWRRWETVFPDVSGWTLALNPFPLRVFILPSLSYSFFAFLFVRVKNWRLYLKLTQNIRTSHSLRLTPMSLVEIFN